MANKRKYNIPYTTCGVYKITNLITGDFYIGSSNNVSNRISLHFNREVKKYPNHKFYQDIKAYGQDNFKVEILEECNRDNKIEREKYYYNLLNPTYNKIPPEENNFLNKEVRELAIKACETEEFKIKRKEINQSKVFREKVREAQRFRFKPVKMFNFKNEYITSFECMQDAGKWIINNSKYKSKNPVSKIKDVCDGKRNTAYGYKWEYKEV